MKYGGIDPGGSSGGWAILNEDGEPLYSQKFKNWKDLIDYIQSYPDQEFYIGIEKVHSMPGNGVKAMFSFGSNYGGWLSALECFQIKHALIPPAKWQTKLLGTFPKGESKIRALDYAQRTWPKLNLNKAVSNKEQQGIVDALCIAAYVRLTHLGK